MSPGLRRSHTRISELGDGHALSFVPGDTGGFEGLGVKSGREYLLIS